MKLIVGLGNPGKEYENTRHNAGFIALDILCAKLSGSFSVSKKFNALIAETKIGREKVFLLKPQTYMNESGMSVRAVLDFYKIGRENVIIFHDDKDIAIGVYKIQSGRSSAGHNGVKSIIEHLGTQEFIRVRLGIKPEHPIADTVDFVLSKLSSAEKKLLIANIEEAIQKIMS
jgi:peptidyl-tRNA hydrolase, PTH1 family